MSKKAIFGDGGKEHEASIRLFVEALLAAGAAVECTAGQANYLGNVLRMRAGQHVLVFNGRDGEWLAEITAMKRSAAVLTAREQVRPQAEGPDLHYLFAPLKKARLDYMVQKATEMGASVLRPVMTRRTNAERVNLERMRANVVEAAEQCGVLRVPEVLAPVKLEAALGDWEPGRALIFADEAAAVASPLEVLRGVPQGPAALLIGPEGGFDDAERQMLLGLPFVHAVSLGPRIMRADTAAVAALALMNAVLGDWR
ncbi:MULTISPECIES: 16S rRNA (uracil(1498)-N(3))-methyltransferase [Rhodomicrobium]|uniref:16S rRNA (uracil(1498)-N(3))-methyltransferase n=1 Tax=Rhodomicrobium TaxID=1068 RepID=UPI000B4A997F|nr:MULTISPECIES: 16S rRNA (uracil(1498)-N(3))-methyltransferase [Rhodomicrobium]